eukprot:g20698.t1
MMTLDETLMCKFIVLKPTAKKKRKWPKPWRNSKAFIKTGRGELEQLGLDLDDIHATISMVEGNRSKFQVSDGELASRKRFANDCHKTLEELQKDRGNVERLLRVLAAEKSARGVLCRSHGKVARRVAFSARRGPPGFPRQENQAFLDRQRQQQMQMTAQQDEEQTTCKMKDVAMTGTIIKPV